MAMIATSLHNSSSAPWLRLEMIFATLQANVMGTRWNQTCYHLNATCDFANEFVGGSLRIALRGLRPYRLRADFAA